MPQDVSDLSYYLNTIGPWSNETVANLGGSQSSVRFSDPISAVLQATQGSPGSLANHAGFLLDTQAAGTPDAENWTIWDWLTFPFLGTIDSAKKAGTAIGSNVVESPQGKTATAGKYVLLASLALILVIFGLWALIGTKTIVTVAKGAAAA